MAKIHTHYDNLKVSRGAPQEVIRAAYKALSQKYHPDKNPGDEKAARIMAILNSAYETLSDPVRRKEHDDWIAAEEWEVEWLESHEGEDKHRHDHPNWPAVPDRLPRRAVLRDPRWWTAMGAALALGALVGVAVSAPGRLLPGAWANALTPRTEPVRVAAAPAPAPAPATARPEPVADPLAAVPDAWAAAPEVHQGPDIRSLGVAQLVIPARAPDCEFELHTLAAPNGEPWPAQTGYVDGYPQANEGDEMRLQIDNSANGSPVFVKVYDLDRHANVRHAFIKAHDSIAIERLAAGKYEVRYQNIEVGATKAECMGRRKQAALRQADAGQAADAPRLDAN
ncbi:MAG TPA: J domain-containing protein [Telluria sp.]|nr:J domain-containing protein [Telluria sp.]